jgi:predicted secreted protein
MSEVPKLPDHSGGDDDRKLLMDPNAAKNELAVVDGGDTQDPGTEISTEVVEQTTEVADDAESAEQKERERLHKEIAHNYTSAIFKAARKIEKPVTNAMDVFSWSLEDQQRLVDALNAKEEQADTSTQCTEAATEANSSEDNSTEEGGSDNAEDGGED